MTATDIKPWDIVKLTGRGQVATWLVVSIEGDEVLLERLGDANEKLTTTRARIRRAHKH